jgi:hypothetical protein
MPISMTFPTPVTSDLGVFFGGAGLPPEVYVRWQRWSRNYERLWLKVVRWAMEAGVLAAGEPKVTTRLLLGMVIWVSRWYRPSERVNAEEIAEAAIQLVGRGAPGAER